MRRSFPATGAACIALALAAVACGHTESRGPAPVASADAGAAPVARNAPPQRAVLTATAVDTTFDTEEHFIAGVEMQLSGEPFAEAMGRDLRGYNRNHPCQESACAAAMYFDPRAPRGPDGTRQGTIDLPGFSSAIESYEYSKQPMNMVAFESGAGTSLLFGPVLNPRGATGAGALALANAWFVYMASRSNATNRFVHPADAADPLGWPGLWPTLQPFSRWDPKIRPTHAAGCSISSDDDRGPKGAVTSGAYECDASSLHLPDRAAQVSPTIGPGPSGWTDWKEALWTLNYLQVMHGGKEHAVPSVLPRQAASVGIPGNSVTGAMLPGVYLGSSDIEGFQAGNFIQILDNQAAQWLQQLTTTDGRSLGGFPSLLEALRYGPASPLRWFPRFIRVSEKPDASGFPAPAGFAITDASSRLLDLAGLLGAYANVYALTDLGNADVGGSEPVSTYFDGDPFPVQNQAPTGAPSLHDRALAMMRVIVVDMDRMHVDPRTGLLVDQATVPEGARGADAEARLLRGATLSSDVAAYALVALRAARRSLGSELTLYGNTTPDTAGIPSPLDAFPPIRGVSFGARIDAFVAALAEAFYTKLTTPDGHAYGGWDVARGAVTDSGTSLDAHTAAVRGLLTAYLATGAIRYRDRAEAVSERVERAFYDPAARIYRATEGDVSPRVTFTPRRFGLLQAMLRDVYELVALLPGHAALAARIEERVGRLNGLVLNGWDDRNQDGRVDWPGECARVGKGAGGGPLGLGGLQMAERALTGESGPTKGARNDPPSDLPDDREHDCVPEISAVGLPAALASSITFEIAPRPGVPPEPPAPVAVAHQAPHAASAAANPRQMHSGSLVSSPAGATLFVAHPDADSVTFVDVTTRKIAREVLLAAAPPATSPSGRYEPAVAPRAVAIDSKGATLFVTGQRSGEVYAIDVASGTVTAKARVCSEPIGVLVGRDDRSVFVACAQDDEVVEVRAPDLARVASASCPRKPWSLAWGADGRTLLATHLLGPGVTAFRTAPLAARKTWPIVDAPAPHPPRWPGAGVDPESAKAPHGQVRGIYDALVRPGTRELWVAHMMLGTDTPQPDLDFRRSVFPALSVFDARGRERARLSVQAKPGDGGAFGDTVSGPHALAFSQDGRFAFVADADSEDVLVVDAQRRSEATLVRPLRGHLPEGVVWSGGKVFVQDRNTEEIEAFRVVEPADEGSVSVEADGPPFKSLAVDPMPPILRLGQKLYFSANSDELPLTRNHWVACASCHLEGRSDAVTWFFTQGPRDTPTNAGGLLDTGFLFRTADRTKVEDYFRTINVEQGGHFALSEGAQGPLLQALAAYVNEAIPLPVPPSTDATHALRGAALDALRAQGEGVFTKVGCPRCHAGPAKTDSGDGNAGLDLRGEVVSVRTSGGVLLHDVGTCVRQGPNPDVAHEDIEGHPRDACAFDTPALRGLTDSAPYLHDGSAATLDDVLPAMLLASAAPGAPPAALSPEDRRALVEYLRGL